MEETERSYNFFERLLFYMLPVLFTLLLTGVLLTVFGYNVADGILRAANKIPGISAMLPDPKPTAEEMREAVREAAQQPQEPSAEETGEEAGAANAELAAVQAEAAALQAESDQKDQRIAELESALQAEREAEAAALATEEEYAANIKKLADVYGGMKASKAAPVLENLTLSERVLVLREMSADQQISILERMQPALAAETSILMKDAVPSRDLQIAALQERLALNGDAAEDAALTGDEVSRTFAQMAPDRAAEVLLEMGASNQDLVVRILRNMEEAPRATILNSLARLDKEKTAAITARLG